MKLLFSAALLICACSSAYAQSPSVFERELPAVVANSIKCEIGEAAVRIRPLHLGPQYSKIKVTVTNANGNSGTLGLAISSIIANLFKFGGTVVRTETDTNKIAISYNFNSKQLPNCSKKNRVRSPPGIGVGRCLAEDTPNIVAQARHPTALNKRILVLRKFQSRSMCRDRGQYRLTSFQLALLGSGSVAEHLASRSTYRAVLEGALVELTLARGNLAG